MCFSFFTEEVAACVWWEGPGEVLGGTGGRGAEEGRAEGQGGLLWGRDTRGQAGAGSGGLRAGCHPDPATVSAPQGSLGVCWEALRCVGVSDLRPLRPGPAAGAAPSGGAWSHQGLATAPPRSSAGIQRPGSWPPRCGPPPRTAPPPGRRTPCGLAREGRGLAPPAVFTGRGVCGGDTLGPSRCPAPGGCSGLWLPSPGRGPGPARAWLALRAAMRGCAQLQARWASPRGGAERPGLEGRAGRPGSPKGVPVGPAPSRRRGRVSPRGRSAPGAGHVHGPGGPRARAPSIHRHRRRAEAGDATESMNGKRARSLSNPLPLPRPPPSPSEATPSDSDRAGGGGLGGRESGRRQHYLYTPAPGQSGRSTHPSPPPPLAPPRAFDLIHPHAGAGGCRCGGGRVSREPPRQRSAADVGAPPLRERAQPGAGWQRGCGRHRLLLDAGVSGRQLGLKENSPSSRRQGERGPGAPRPARARARAHTHPRAHTRSWAAGARAQSCGRREDRRDAPSSRASGALRAPVPGTPRAKGGDEGGRPPAARRCLPLFGEHPREVQGMGSPQPRDGACWAGSGSSGESPDPRPRWQLGWRSSPEPDPAPSSRFNVSTWMKRRQARASGLGR